MGLEVPELDDRGYGEILEDAMKLLPVHTEEWTDHNAHDPGVTVLELLAWVAETYEYQLDRVTDAHRAKYLKLMGAPPRPPEPATAELTLEPPDDGDWTIPADEPLVVDDGSGEPKRFETTAPVTLTRARIERVVSEHRRDRTDQTNANRTEGLHFLAFGTGAERGSALYVGFAGDPFEADRLDLAVDFHEADLPAPATHGEESPEFEPSVELAWQYCTDYGEWYREAAWADLTVIEDDTNRLYRGGTVTLSRPDDWPGPATGVGVLDHADGLAWIRCVVETAGYEVPPQLDALRVNAVTAEHRAGRGRERLDRADGGEETTAQPGQTFVFGHAPVLDALDATITVGGEEWTPVPDFDGSGPDDEHYVVDAMEGSVRFGDGVRGAVPEAGQRVFAESYTAGGGEGGNVPASSAWTFEGDRFRNVPVAPRGGATGGRDAETVDEARSRLKEDMKTPYRVVTPDDYASVATSTPGLRFGRAAAIVRPDEPVEGCETHYAVRVVVVPFGTGDRPEPSDGFLSAVGSHLERHRLLTDRVTVEPPVYVGVGVDAEVELAAGYSVAGRTAAVEAALDGFLDPLSGFEGEGWPFGRPLYRSEVYEVLEGVEGVDCVLDVSIRTRGEAGTDDEGSVLIPDSALLYPERHGVTVRTASGGEC